MRRGDCHSLSQNVPGKQHHYTVMSKHYIVMVRHYNVMVRHYNVMVKHYTVMLGQRLETARVFRFRTVGHGTEEEARSWASVLRRLSSIPRWRLLS